LPAFYEQGFGTRTTLQTRPFTDNYMQRINGRRATSHAELGPTIRVGFAVRPFAYPQEGENLGPQHSILFLGSFKVSTDRDSCEGFYTVLLFPDLRELSRPCGTGLGNRQMASDHRQCTRYPSGRAYGNPEHPRNQFRGGDFQEDTVLDGSRNRRTVAGVRRMLRRRARWSRALVLAIGARLRTPTCIRCRATATTPGICA